MRVKQNLKREAEKSFPPEPHKITYKGQIKNTIKHLSYSLSGLILKGHCEAAFQPLNSF
jgi:CRISPR/Cas system endoribonuclease Cas6 (RAMP superfamily)